MYGTWSGPGLLDSIVADVNGDGLDDLIYPYRVNPDETIAPLGIAINTGTGFLPTVDSASVANLVPFRGGDFNLPYYHRNWRVLVADVNRDGKQDLLTYGAGNTGLWDCGGSCFWPIGAASNSLQVWLSNGADFELSLGSVDQPRSRGLRPA